MTVAVKLSRKLYETLGDEAADAMVAWMDSVERNRAELREISDLSFARIDARFGEAEARSDARFQRIDARFEGLESRFREMGAHFEARLAQEIGRVEARIDQRFADLLKWSFSFWIGSTVTLVGVLIAFSRLR